MKRTLLSMVALMVLVSSGKAYSADYKMENPSVATMMSGDVALSKSFKINLTKFSLWSDIGKGNSSTLNSYIFVPFNLGGTIVSPGVGIVNNFPKPDQFAGTLAVSAFGNIGSFSHFSEVDLYVSEKQVDVWATTRWLTQPISGLGLNIGAQAYLFNTHVSVGPEISYDIPYATVGVQAIFGESSYSFRGVARCFF